MTKLYCLKHQFGSEFGFVKINKEDSETYSYVDREDATIFDSIEEIEKVVDNMELEVELVTFLISKNI